MSVRETITCSFAKRKLNYSAPNNTSGIPAIIRSNCFTIKACPECTLPSRFNNVCAESLIFFSKERQFK